MVETLSRSAPGSQTPLLLPSKINPPLARSRLVARPGLLGRLDAALSSALLLVAAPAGFGKTTLLVDWAAHLPEHVRVCWLSLEDGDNDPTRFWTGVVSALSSRRVGVSPDVLAYLQAPVAEDRAIQTFIDALIADLVDLGQDVVLILDDYHTLHSHAVHAGMLYLLEHLPDRLHLLISSRSDPPFPLARMRVSGRLCELRAADLRFSVQEAGVFLRDVMQLPLSAEDVAALDGRTEGWAAGLQLAALSLRERSDPSAAIAGFTGTHRFIIDYLVEEVLARLPAPLQAFLEQTSIMRQLSGPVCDAVTEGEGGAATLEQLERASLFVTPVDEQRRWYRYHQLFADTLRHRLEREDPLLVPELHRRACAWYAANDLVEEAVEHALASADWDIAAGLIDRVYRELLDRGEQVTLKRWLESVPPHVRQTHPILSGVHALALLVNSELTELDRFLRLAESALEERGEMVSLARLLGAHAQLACVREQAAIGAECAERALALLPPEDASFRSAALLALATIATRRGELARAEAALGQVVEITRTAFAPMASFHVRVLLGHVHAAAGRLHRAAGYYSELLEEIGERPLVMREAALLGLAGLAREWNRLDEAENTLEQVLTSRRGRGRREGHAPPLLWLERARVLAIRGHVGPAGDALQSAAAAAQHVNSGRLRRLVDAFQVRLALQMGDLAGAERWAAGVSAESPSVWDFDDWTRALSLVRVWLAQARPEAALALLDALIPAAEEAGAGFSLVEMLALRALALNQSGDEGTANETFERALDLAEPEGYVRVFADEREPMVLLLRRALSRGVHPRYTSMLLGACGAAGTSARPAPAVLTAREREVLRLLGLGLSNREIAEHLVLTEGTVKSHVHNLISKLGVGSRTQVLLRAREIGAMDS